MLLLHAVLLTVNVKTKNKREMGNGKRQFFLKWIEQKFIFELLNEKKNNNNKIETVKHQMEFIRKEIIFLMPAETILCLGRMQKKNVSLFFSHAKRKITNFVNLFRISTFHRFKFQIRAHCSSVTTDSWCWEVFYWFVVLSFAISLASLLPTHENRQEDVLWRTMINTCVDCCSANSWSRASAGVRRPEGKKDIDREKYNGSGLK